MIVHEPGGECILVDGQLSPACLGGTGLQEVIRRHVELLSQKTRERAHLGSSVVVYVPREISPAMPDLPGDSAVQHFVIASAPTLLLILRSVAARWLVQACATGMRSLVDSAQDLVADFSSFISDFTENEGRLSALVESCAQAARCAAAIHDLLQRDAAPTV